MASTEATNKLQEFKGVKWKSEGYKNSLSLVKIAIFTWKYPNLLNQDF